MSLADTIAGVAKEVAEHEEIISLVGKPLLQLIREALEAGVTHESLAETIKQSMIAAAYADMKEELGP